jgi:hypothetical protein
MAAKVQNLNRKVEFLSEGPNTAPRDEGGNIRWIGFRAVSITGEEKEFWWWRNFTDTIENLKAFCGSLLAQRLIEAQIGPAVDLFKSSQTTGEVRVFSKVKKKPAYGIYIEAKHRPMFDFMLAMEGLEMPKTVKEGFF